MKKILLSLVAIFALSACGSPNIDMAPSYTQGEYRVTAIDIQPKHPEMLADTDFQNAKMYLTKRLGEVLLNKSNKKPDVKMTIVISDVSLEINSVRSIMIGDSYRISTTVTLYDAATSQQIASFPVSAVQDTSGGIGAAIGNSIVNSMTPERRRAKKMLEAYMHDLFRYLYPRSNK